MTQAGALGDPLGLHTPRLQQACTKLLVLKLQRYSSPHSPMLSGEGHVKNSRQLLNRRTEAASTWTDPCFYYVVCASAQLDRLDLLSERSGLMEKSWLLAANKCLGYRVTQENHSTLLASSLLAEESLLVQLQFFCLSSQTGQHITSTEPRTNAV